MVIVVICCLTLLLCTGMVCRTLITLHSTNIEAATDTAIKDIEEVYEQLDKEDPVPTFADVIQAINREFGGIDYDE